MEAKKLAKIGKEEDNAAHDKTARYQNSLDDVVKMAQENSEKVVNLDSLGDIIKMILSIDLLEMNKQKVNRMKSIASVVASVRNKATVNMEESVDTVCEMLELDREYFLFLLDLVGADPYKIFGFLSDPSSLGLDDVMNLQSTKFNFDRIDVIQELLGVSSSDAVITVAKIYIRAHILAKQANAYSKEVYNKLNIPPYIFEIANIYMDLKDKSGIVLKENIRNKMIDILMDILKNYKK